MTGERALFALLLNPHLGALMGSRMPMKSKSKDSSVDSNRINEEESVGAIASGDWFLVSPHMLIGVVGAVACFAWAFLAMGTNAYAPAALENAGGGGIITSFSLQGLFALCF